MNIRDINTGSSQFDRLRSDSAQEANGAQAGPDKASGRPDASAADGDRVEISEAARAAQQNDVQTAELQFAQKALTELPPLSEARAQEIIERIEEGYYSKPENVKQIAEQLAREFGGQ